MSSPAPNLLVSGDFWNSKYLVWELYARDSHFSYSLLYLIQLDNILVSGHPFHIYCRT
jgi:hypothetical protein